LPVTEGSTGLHWLYEEGVGEARAALVQKGGIVEAQIERAGDRIFADGFD